MFIVNLVFMDEFYCNNSIYDNPAPTLSNGGFRVLLTSQGFQDYVAKNIDFSTMFLSEFSIPDFTIEAGPL